MAESQRYARVPAETGRASWRKDAGHTATVGRVQGQGASQAKALDNLASLLTQAAGREATDSPSAWWDEANAVLWVAVPDVMHGGHTSFNIRMTGSGPVIGGGSEGGTAPASEAFATSAGMRRVEREPYRRSDEASCPMTGHSAHTVGQCPVPRVMP
jgi:hypothetical protein